LARTYFATSSTLASVIDRWNTTLAKENKTQAAADVVHDVLLEDPHSQAAQSVEKDISVQAGIIDTAPPALKPKDDKPVSIELRNAKVKVAFEALSRSTGINFILDKDIKKDTKVTLFVKDARIQDAIEMVLASNGLKKKILSENTVFIYPNTPKKLKDYQDLMLRSFYLSNADAKQIGTMVKTLLKTKDVYVDERLNRIVLRDTPDVIRLAEKLIYSNDLADPEVMLEMEVLEITRNRLQQLGITYPSSLSVALGTVTTTAADGTTSAADSILTLANIDKLKSENYQVGPNPRADFRKETGDVDLLSNPRIRVRNREKANIHVGERVPTFTSNIVGANGNVSENVTYVDVGLKLEVEPRITLDNYVNILIGLEVNSLGARAQSSNGTTAFTIGTRRATTNLRLKDGETQILAGLISDEERKNAIKVPGLGDLPIVGRLFSNQEDKKDKTEIILAITPRIISNIQPPNADDIEYWSGTKSVITDKPNVISTPVLTSGERKRAQANERAQSVRDRIRQAREKAKAKQEARESNKNTESSSSPNNSQLESSSQPAVPSPAAEEAPDLIDTIDENI